VYSGADSGPDDGVMGVGIALLGEGLEVAVAVLVDIVDNPCLPRLPAGPFQMRLRTDMASLSLKNASASQQVRMRERDKDAT
jgi:hypothetical protein